MANRKIYILIMTMLFGCFGTANAQVKVTDGANLTIDSNSLLEMESVNKGLLIPRMAINNLNLPAPLTAPVPAGMLIYSTGGSVTDGFYYWGGSKWVKFIQVSVQVDEGGTGLTSGTSGGIPAFTGSTTIISSGVLTQNAIIIGGGAGATPSSLALGTSNKILGINAGGTAHEYKSINGTSNQIGITDAVGSITLSTPQDINTISFPTFAGLTLTTPLSVANGGTGSSSQNFVDLTTVQTSAGAKTWSALGTFNLGLTASGAAVNLNANSNFVTNINTGTSTGNVNIGSINGASSLTQRVGTGNFSLDGVGASNYTIAPSSTTGTIAIGGTAQAGSITLGSSTIAQTLNLGTGNGASTVNIGTGTTAATINIATGDVAGVIKIGDNTGVTSSSVQIGGSTTINGAFNLCNDNSVAGTDTFTATNPNITNLAVGLAILFNSKTNNTGACSLNLNGSGNIAITNQDGTAPGNGDIRAGGYQFLVYTGSTWILIGRN